MRSDKFFFFLKKIDLILVSDLVLPYTAEPLLSGHGHLLNTLNNVHADPFTRANFRFDKFSLLEKTATPVFQQTLILS